MRTVTGPTDHVVVVGAGLSGLAAALYLRGSGRRVTVLERNVDPGGRVGVFRGPDYEADSGATVLTMPSLITDALAAVDAAGATALRFVRVEPAYHARFADGRHLDVYADRDAMVAEVQRFAGAEEARRYVGLRRWLGDVFDAEYERFMASNFDSPLDLIATGPARRDLARLLRLGGFARLGRRVGHLLTDPDLARVFTFQSLYAGVAPADALGVYAAIAHMDTSLGVYFPIGGMRAIARSMVDALRAAGGIVETNTDVDRIEYVGRRADPGVRPRRPPLRLRRTGAHGRPRRSGVISTSRRPRCARRRRRWSRSARSRPRCPTPGRAATTASNSVPPGRRHSPRFSAAD